MPVSRFLRLYERMLFDGLNPDAARELGWFLDIDVLAQRQELCDLVETKTAVDLLDAAAMWHYETVTAVSPMSDKQRIAARQTEMARRIERRERHFSGNQ